MVIGIWTLLGSEWIGNDQQKQWRQKQLLRVFSESGVCKINVDRQIKQMYFRAPPFPITMLAGRNLRRDPRRIHVYFCSTLHSAIWVVLSTLCWGDGAQPCFIFWNSTLILQTPVPWKLKSRESDNAQRRRKIKYCGLLRPNGTQKKSCLFPSCFSSYPTRRQSV